MDAERDQGSAPIHSGRRRGLLPTNDALRGAKCMGHTPVARGGHGINGIEEDFHLIGPPEKGPSVTGTLITLAQALTFLSRRPGLRVADMVG